MLGIIRYEKMVLTMRDPVLDMIGYIKRIYDNNEDIVNNISNPHLLYDALYDLYEIIGMPKIKESIIKLIKFLLVEKRTEGNKFENHMLHTVIYGPPGVGKTMVGSVLAKIWSALGVLPKPKRSIENRTPAREAREAREYAFGKPTISAMNRARDKSPLKLPPIRQPINKTKPLLSRTKHQAPIKIVSRNEFVAHYVGQTADKTRRLLIDTLNEGKALFIDEAYSLVNDERDSFGHEALHELNKFMSEHPELVIIFAGYKDQIEATIFKSQPGFKRRCTWIFEIDKYTPHMLSLIFRRQLSTNGWAYDESDETLTEFFRSRMDYFRAYGGDTLRLVLHCKLRYSEIRFDEDIDKHGGKIDKKIINFQIIREAFEQYIDNGLN